MDDTPSKEEFLSGIFAINPDGDIDATYARLIYKIEYVFLKNGDKITYDFLKQKYHSFIKKWNYLYASKEKAGYLPKDAPKRDLSTFLGDEMYEQIFEIPKSNVEREQYLFGTEPRNNMYEAVRKFREKYKI